MDDFGCYPFELEHDKFCSLFADGVLCIFGDIVCALRLLEVSAQAVKTDVITAVFMRSVVQVFDRMAAARDWPMRSCAIL